MKAETIIVDIDGVVFFHTGEGPSRQWDPDILPAVNPGVYECFDQWEMRGCHIILMTARKECGREALVKHLKMRHIIYDQLIMGVTSGQRTLINDAKPTAMPSAVARTIPRNEGLGSLIE
jgi:hypothetical protein